jgi:nitrite reductase/ring-hydroxylating ferredoxin subunit
MPDVMEHRVEELNRLPLFPASWYLFGETRVVAAHPVVKNMLGRDIVAFRTGSGNLVAMDAHCSHFGANLGNGRVAGETIQCPYHGWKYGADGKCASIPSGCPIPEFARQKIYAAQERHGYVFIYNGEAPTFPLPWFDELAAQDFEASRAFEFTANCFWPAVTGHAFDLQHFLFVHDRRLLEPPLIDVPAPYVRRTRYRAQIVPRSWRDKALTLAGARNVTASLEIFGGTFALITADFGRVTSRFMMIMRPINRQKTLCQGIVFGSRSSRIPLAVRRYFTEAYLAEENRTLGQTAPVPERFVESDGPLGDYFHFLEDLCGVGEAS